MDSALILSFKGEVAKGVLAENQEASHLEYTSTPEREGDMFLDAFYKTWNVPWLRTASLE